MNYVSKTNSSYNFLIPNSYYFIELKITDDDLISYNTMNVLLGKDKLENKIRKIIGKDYNFKIKIKE